MKIKSVDDHRVYSADYVAAVTMTRNLTDKTRLYFLQRPLKYGDSPQITSTYKPQDLIAFFGVYTHQAISPAALLD